MNVHALLAVGENAEGYREILGLHVTSAEDGAGWLSFFRDLVARGLTGVRLVTSYAHRGLVEAIRATLPGASWQRCRTHYTANLPSVTPKASWGWVKALLHSVYDQPDAEAVHAQFDRIVDALGDNCRRWLRTSTPPAPTSSPSPPFPKAVWRQIWSNDPQARLNLEGPPRHRRRGHLPRPRLTDPTGRRRACRTTRRMDRDAIGLYAALQVQRASRRSLEVGGPVG